MFLFREGLSFFISRLVFNSSTIFLFSLISTLHFLKDGEWIKIINDL